MSLQVIPEGHLEGRPVSASTYKNFGCRCDGCRHCATAYQRTMRQRGGRIKAHDKAQSVATYNASVWVRENFPAVWERLYQHALERVLDRGEFVPTPMEGESVTPAEETV
jgi:hypothetical protein